MDYNIGIIANPWAGSGVGRLSEVKSLIGSRPFSDRVTYLETNDVSEIAPTLRRLVEEKKVTVIYVWGGDGTLHHVVDILIYEHLREKISTMPLILSLGGGSMKAIYQWLGWNSNPLSVFMKVAQTPLSRLPVRKLRPLAITFFNVRKNRVETHYGFIFIIGAVTRVIELYDEDGKSPLNGIKHIALGAMGAVTGVPQSHRDVVHQFFANVSVNGQRVNQTEPLSVICSVADSLLFGKRGIKPFLGRPESNQFYCASYEVPAWIVSLCVPILVRATYVPQGKRFFNQPVFNCRIVPIEEKTIFVDGDFYEIKPGEEISITLGPEISLIPSF